MDAVQGPQPWGKVRTGSTGRPPGPVPIFLSPSHTLHEGPLWTTRDLLHRKNLRGERSRGKATATTERHSPARPEMLNHCRNPPSGRGSRALWPRAALRMTEEAARRLPVSGPPPNPASAWSPTHHGSGAGLAGGLLQSCGSQSTAETTTRRSTEKAAGFWRRRRRAGQSIPETSIGLQRFPALKAPARSGAGGASEEVGPEIGGKHCSRDSGGS